MFSLWHTNWEHAEPLFGFFGVSLTPLSSCWGKLRRQLEKETTPLLFMGTPGWAPVGWVLLMSWKSILKCRSLQCSRHGAPAPSADSTRGSLGSELELDDHGMERLDLRFVSIPGSNMKKVGRGSKKYFYFNSWFSVAAGGGGGGYCLKQWISPSRSVLLLAADEFLRCLWSVLWLMLWAAADFQEQLLSCSLLHKHENFPASPKWMSEQRSWAAFRWLQGWFPVVRAF